MSINPNINPNIDPNVDFNIDDVNPSGESVESLVDDHFISTLSKSDLEALIVNLMASFPMLGYFPMASLLDSPALSGKFTKEQVEGFIVSLGQTKDEIISQMLDAWLANVELQAEMQKEDAIKTDEQKEDSKKRRLQQEIVREANNPIANSAAYTSYLASLPISERAAEVSNIADKIVDHYISTSNTPAFQNAELAKAVMPLYIMEALVINPSVQQIVLAPTSAQSAPIGVNPIADQVQPAMNQFSPNLQDQTLLTINLFVMEMVKNTTIEMYLKQGGDAATKPKDIEFATAFAVQMLEKVRTPGFIEGELLKNVPGAEQMPLDHFQVAVALVKAFAMLNAVMLFVKVEGGTLQERELKEMLTGETDIPQGDKRGELLAEIRDIIDGLPKGDRADFATTLLKYVGSMPDTDRLTNWIHALNAAMEEVSPAQRVVQAPST